MLWHLRDPANESVLPVLIFAGAMLGFVLARFQYLNIEGNYAKGAAPGEWYWYRAGYYRIGITIHLACALPAGFLMVWQFVPSIRRNFLLFHRINGYVVSTLVILSNVGALMIVRRSFGGNIETQTAVGVLVVLTTVGIAMGFINIKKLQVDQHRAWMLRTMFYLGTIVSDRVLMIISAMITSAVRSYFVVMSCDEIAFIVRDDIANIPEYMRRNYPGCFIDPRNTSSASASIMSDNKVVVQANILSDKTEGTAAAFRLTFGTALWLAILLHLVGVELYLALTPRESHRLRQVAYQKQLDAGMRNPGSGGLVLERFGDADEWVYDRPARKVSLDGR
ncbi:hypothetical protein LTR70_002888 [Exophiala xenobiotica]|nr:hypothetical protein LTR70_002888 [Exophiala xenobiotica]